MSEFNAASVESSIVLDLTTPIREAIPKIGNAARSSSKSSCPRKNWEFQRRRKHQRFVLLPHAGEGEASSFTVPSTTGSITTIPDRYF
jgi:hypothetical protein